MGKPREPLWDPVKDRLARERARDRAFDRERVHPPQRRPEVYFLLDETANAVKIGTAKDTIDRIADIQACSATRLKLLGVVIGGIYVERWCHFYAFPHRLHHEWFRWNGGARALSEFVLAHGREAAALLCLKHLTADGLAVSRRPVFAGRCSPLPHDGRSKTDRDRKYYLSQAKKRMEPLGLCPCDLCDTKPWESW